MTLRFFHSQSLDRGSGVHHDDYFDCGCNAWPHWSGLGWVGGPCRIDNGVYIFSMADGLETLLGKTGIDVVTRLLGMLLAALSVQFVLEGFFAFLPANGGVV